MSGAMYVLMVSFYRVVAPVSAPATADVFFSEKFDAVPFAVSHDREALEREAGAIKERFSATYHSHWIRAVKAVGEMGCQEEQQPRTCGECEEFRRCCDCGGGWCMELLEPTNEADEACEEHDPDADGRARA